MAQVTITIPNSDWRNDVNNVIWQPSDSADWIDLGVSLSSDSNNRYLIRLDIPITRVANFGIVLADSLTDMTIAGDDFSAAMENDGTITLTASNSDSVEITGISDDETEPYFWKPSNIAAINTFAHTLAGLSDRSLTVVFDDGVAVNRTGDGDAIDIDASLGEAAGVPTRGGDGDGVEAEVEINEADGVSTAPTDVVTITIPNSGWQTGTLLRWNPGANNYISLGTSLSADGNTELFFGFLGLPAVGSVAAVRLRLAANQSENPNNAGPDFSVAFETGGLITFTASDGSSTTLENFGSSDPYLWTPSNHSDVVTFAANLARLSDRSLTVAFDPTPPVIRTGDGDDIDLDASLGEADGAAPSAERDGDGDSVDVDASLGEADGVPTAPPIDPSYDQSGKDFEVLAQITAGDDNGFLLSSTVGNIASTTPPADMTLGSGADIFTIVNIRLHPTIANNLVLSGPAVTGSAFDLNAWFTTGDGQNYTIDFQTSGGLVSIEPSERTREAGAATWVRFTIPAADRTALDAISAGDSFVFAIQQAALVVIEGDGDGIDAESALGEAEGVAADRVGDADGVDVNVTLGGAGGIAAEFQHPGLSLFIDWDRDGSYSHAESDVTADVISEIHAWRGREYGSQVKARSVAGSISANLRNDGGKYSSKNPASPLFGINPEGLGIQLRMGNVALWTGEIDEVDPSPQRSGADYVTVSGLGALYKLRRPVSISQREEISIGDAADLIYAAIDVGGTADLNGDKIMSRWWAHESDGLTEMHALEETEEGFLHESPTGRIVLHAGNARRQGNYAVSALTLARRPVNSEQVALIDLKPKEERKAVANSFVVPISQYSISDVRVLWSPGQQITIGPGETVVLRATYPTPSAPLGHIAAAEWEAMVAGTDYPSGMGLTVNAVEVEDGLRISISNTSAVAVTPSVLQARGKAVVLEDPILIEREDLPSIALYGRRPYPDPSPWLRNFAVGYEYADSYLASAKDPRETLQATWLAQDRALLARNLDLARRVTVIDDDRTVNCAIEAIGHSWLRGGRHLVHYTLSINPPPTRPSTVPPILQPLTVTSLSVSWPEPFDGGSPITGYSLRYRTGAGAWIAVPVQGTTRVATITGLMQGTLYEAQLMAHNAIGDSDWSASSYGTTTLEAPSAPTAPVVTPDGDRVLSVTWTAPYNGGSPITGYELECRKQGDLTWETCTATITAASARVTATMDGTALERGTTYQFRVRAVNAIGAGMWSQIGSGTTSSVAPLAPTNLRSTQITPTAVTVQWDAPDDGGSTITAYEVSSKLQSVMDWTVNGTTTNLTFSVPTMPGMDYHIRVRAQNANGFSPYSDVLSQSTSATVPDAPSNVSATISAQTATITFTVPNNNGATILGYQYGWKVSTAQNWNSSSSATIQNLSPGVAYNFRVRAQNSEGFGAWGESAAITVPATAPNVPTFSLSHSGTTATVSITAPAANGSPITAYDVEYEYGNFPWMDATPAGGSVLATTWTFTTETNTTHRVRVRARNAIGWSAYSPIQTVTTGLPPATVPSIVKNITAVISNITTATISHDTPSANGSPITQYGYRYRTVAATSWTVATSNVITGLTRGESYQFGVRARNGIGWGAWGTSALSYTIAAVTVPSKPVVTFNAEMRYVNVNTTTFAIVGLRFGLDIETTVADNGGSPITSYNIRHRRSIEVSWTTATDNNNDFRIFQLSDFATGTLWNTLWGRIGWIYQAQVQAVNAQGNSEWSDIVSYTISNNTPEAPAGLRENPSASIDRIEIGLRSGTGNSDHIASAPTEAEARFRRSDSPLLTYPIELSGARQGDQRQALYHITDLSSLDQGAEYQWQARMRNAQGWGAWADGPAFTL